MPCDFQFKLQNSRKASIRLMANSILLLNGFILLYITLNFSLFRAYLVFACWAVIATVLDTTFKRKDWLFHSSGVVLAFIGWMGIGYWWIGIIMLGLSAFAEMVSVNKQICFCENEISTTTLFGTIYQWKNLQNVILKDGLLTMDFRNNKLLQVLINQEINPAQELEFNDFCLRCLKTNS
jgi:hypothetical protein